MSPGLKMPRSAQVSGTVTVASPALPKLSRAVMIPSSGCGIMMLHRDTAIRTRNESHRDDHMSTRPGHGRGSIPLRAR